MTLLIDDADAIALGGRLGDETGIFDFEADFAADLRCIPMVVRFKLDRVGVKLSLRQWSKVGRDNRRQLLALVCDTLREIDAYRQTLIRLVAMHSGDAIVTLPADPDPAWTNPTQVPVRITQQAQTSGVAPPTALAWSGLSTLQRFALLKLARSNHDNDNFVPALREFGLI